MSKDASVSRRGFLGSAVAVGAAACAGLATAEPKGQEKQPGEFYEEPAKRLPARKFDVVVTGGGTAGVVAALAAARHGAKTALIELKGYTGGIITEGGTALHSFFNVWKPYQA